MVGAIHSSKTLVLTRATRQNIPEDGVLHEWKWPVRKARHRWEENIKVHMKNSNLT
jgi:hypothetical protein